MDEMKTPPLSSTSLPQCPSAPAEPHLPFSLPSLSSHALDDTAPPPANNNATAQLSPRWLSDLKQRIGKCITFGLTPAQTAVAGTILAEVARDWRELVAGSEGYLTSPDRRSLHRWPVAWGEQDSMGHVNNVTYNRYAESGRIAWVQKYARTLDPLHGKIWEQLGTPKGELGMILRKITTEFKFLRRHFANTPTKKPMMFPDHISVYHKLHREPGEKATDALMLDVIILSELHQRPAARLFEDCALYDYRKHRKATMPPWMADVFRETWRLQEEARKVNSARVAGLLELCGGGVRMGWEAVVQTVFARLEAGGQDGRVVFVCHAAAYASWWVHGMASSVIHTIRTACMWKNVLQRSHSLPSHGTSWRLQRATIVLDKNDSAYLPPN
ncbi:hypothetical protein Q7P37_008610 [Cladosporium fusiforme]